MNIDVFDDAVITEGVELVPLYFVLSMFEAVATTEELNLMFSGEGIAEVDIVTEIVGIV